MDPNERFLRLALRLGALSAADCRELAERSRLSGTPAWELARSGGLLGPEALERLQRAWKDESGPSHPAATEPRAATAPAPTAPAPTAPGLPARYRAAGELGRGGMGRVLRVADTVLGREVALKQLLDGASPASRQRFQHEAQVTGQLEHPAIVPLYDAPLDPAQGWFTMKLVQGRSLGKLLRAVAAGEAGEEGELPALLRVFLRVCEAVAYAHSRGVLHRDLKPDNVMVGAFGEVLVMDWGLARVAGRPDLVTPARDAAAGVETLLSAKDARLTQEGTILGTLAYMPPEQADGALEEIDARSDVYSLGAILYELLALRPPFAGGTLPQLLRQVLDVPPRPPQQVAPRGRAVPRELAAIALKALAKEKAERYGDVPALARDVTLFLEGRSVSACPDGPLRRGLKWGARHAGAVAAVGVVLLSLAGAGMAVSAIAGRAARERADGADRERRLAEEKAAAESSSAQAARRRVEAMERYLEVAELVDRNLTQAELRERVLPELEKAVAIDPSFTEAWLRLGSAWVLVHEPDRAMAALSRARELAPGRPAARALFLQAELTRDAEGRADQARPYYLAAAEADPEGPWGKLGAFWADPQAHPELPGQVLAEHPLLPDANQAQALAVQLGPGGPETLRATSAALARALILWRPNWRVLLRLFECALGLGELYHDAGSWAQSEEAYRNAQSLLGSLAAHGVRWRDPQELARHFHRHAESLLRAAPRRDPVGEALELLQRARALDPPTAAQALLKEATALLEPDAARAGDADRLLLEGWELLAGGGDPARALGALLVLVAGMEAGRQEDAARGLERFPASIDLTQVELAPQVPGWEERLPRAAAMLAAALRGEPGRAALVARAELVLREHARDLLQGGVDAQRAGQWEVVHRLSGLGVAAVGSLSEPVPELELQLRSLHGSASLTLQRYTEVQACLEAEEGLLPPLLEGQGPAPLVEMARRYRLAMAESAAQHARAQLGKQRPEDALLAASVGLRALQGWSVAPLAPRLNLLGARATAAFNLRRYAEAASDLEACLAQNPGGDPQLAQRAGYDAWNLALARAWLAGPELTRDPARRGVVEALGRAVELGLRLAGELIDRQAVLAPLREDPQVAPLLQRLRAP